MPSSCCSSSFFCSFPFLTQQASLPPARILSRPGHQYGMPCNSFKKLLSNLRLVNGIRASFEDLVYPRVVSLRVSVLWSFWVLGCWLCHLVEKIYAIWFQVVVVAAFFQLMLTGTGILAWKEIQGTWKPFTTEVDMLFPRCYGRKPSFEYEIFFLVLIIEK